MAKKLVCDRCGGDAVGEVAVTLQAMSVVVPDRATAVQHVLELCDACRPAGARELLERALAQLERDIPIHRDLIAERDHEAQLLMAQRLAVEKRDAATTVDPADLQLLAAQVDTLTVQIDASRKRQQAILERAK